MAANTLSGLRFVFDLVGLISEAPSGIMLFHMKKRPDISARLVGWRLTPYPTYGLSLTS